MKFRFMRNQYIKTALISILVIAGLFTYLNMVDNNKITKSLSMDEKLEDVDYLFDMIEKNYPFLKVNERLHGIDWLAERDNFKEVVKSTTKDYEFEYEMSQILKKLNNGHTHIVNKDVFGYFYSVYSDENKEKEYKPWFDILSDKSVVSKYDFDEKAIETYSSNQSIYSNIPYCKTDIIVPNEVAYIKISEMNNERIEKDGLIIREFLEETKDYKKLIIDIRQNPGGNDLYWIKNIVQPLAKEHLSATNYLFVRDDYGKEFYEARGMEVSNVSEIDNNILNSFPEEIKTDYKYYYLSTRTINPENPIDFKGEIYVLVDKWVFSAAESFATFSKDTGFATLVGEVTAGDGIGLDPIFIKLPNSNLIVRFSAMMELNKDGTINAEVKTIPHIEMNAAIGQLYEKDQCIQYVINK